MNNVFTLTKWGCLFLLFIFFNKVSAQNDSVALAEIFEFQMEQNQSYKDSIHSPLLKEGLIGFMALNYYPVNLSYRVEAKLYRDTTSDPFEMKTSTARKPKYRKYGRLSFVLLDKEFQLPVYQNMELMKDSAYADYLFLPFTDLTNGDSTYGGGRYLDLKIPVSNSLIIDFNQCYQPYCAYNHKYSCPIPPIENHMDIEVLAGVRNGIQKIKEK